MTPERPEPKLDDIRTEWSRLGDADYFADRYAPAVRGYLAALLGDPAAAEEVAQDFLLRAVERGFPHAERGRGRFRDYLKAALRNAARTHRRREAARPGAAGLDPDELPAPAPEADPWLEEWRRCLIGRAWAALADEQRSRPGNHAATLLRLRLDHPADDAVALARRLADATGVTLRPGALRQQLSRARRLFAERLVAEVAATVDPPAAGAVDEELAALGLLAYVRGYLPGQGERS